MRRSRQVLPATGVQADLQEAGVEARRLARHDHVAGQGHVQTGPHRRAVDRGDRGQRRAGHPQEAGVDPPQGLLVAARGQVVEVGTGAERPARTRDHHGAHVVALLELVHRRDQLGVQRRRDRVAAVGVVEGDRRDAVVDVELDHLGSSPGHPATRPTVRGRGYAPPPCEQKPDVRVRLSPHSSTGGTMTAVMQGVRILEVAEHTFVPAASALLADWGAEVIKIEHVERGDAMRGLASSGTVDLGDDVHVLLEHSNRGKQSLGLDLTTDEGLDILYKLAATCDVFLTNKLPSVRTKLQHRRRRHPGPQPRTSSTCAAPARASAAPTPTRAPTTRSPSGAGPASPWARSGPTYDYVPPPPGARLRRLHRRDDHRRRDHGRALPPRAHRRGHRSSTCRCSAPACGRWAPAIALSLQLGIAVGARRRVGARAATRSSATTAPATAASSRSCCLQAGKYWPEACRR